MHDAAHATQRSRRRRRRMRQHDALDARKSGRSTSQRGSRRRTKDRTRDADISPCERERDDRELPLSRCRTDVRDHPHRATSTFQAERATTRKRRRGTSLCRVSATAGWSSSCRPDTDERAKLTIQQVPFSPQSSVNAAKPQFNSPTKPMPWQNSNTGNSGVRPKACFNCGDPSHFKPNCPLLQTGAANTYQPPVNSQNQPPRGCFLCGDMSHFKRNCPSAPNNSSTTVQGNVQQNRILTGNRYVDDSRVYVKATIEGNSVDCLLDSGCQQTMMPLDLIKRCGYLIRPTNKVVRAANGTVMEFAGEARVRVCLGDEYISVMSLISHDVEEVMLGFDFLVENNCVWSCGCNQIHIRGKPYKPFARQGPPKCRRVFVTSDVVLPAKQQVDLPVRSTITSLSAFGGTFATEAKSIQHGVYMGRTLLPSAHHDIAVRAVNTTSEPRLIKKGTYLGTLTSVSTVCDGDLSAASFVDKPVKPASQELIDALPSEISDQQRQSVTSMIKSV